MPQGGRPSLLGGHGPRGPGEEGESQTSSSGAAVPSITPSPPHTPRERRYQKLFLTRGGLGANTVVFPWRRRCAGGRGHCLGLPGAWAGEGEAHCTPAHRAKRASSERSGFFRPEGWPAAGAGASDGGEGRSGTISAALARSSRNLSNSATATGAAVGDPLPALSRAGLVIGVSGSSLPGTSLGATSACHLQGSRKPQGLGGLHTSAWLYGLSP